MKINQSIEQGLYVLLMLALQKDHTPLKSQVLSQRLEVSDSYLKKILRKLVVADLVTSSASKDGGFTLKRPITTISLFDVCQAVNNLGTLELPALQLAQRLFPGNDAHIAKSTQHGQAAFQQAQTAFNTSLQTVMLDSFLEPDSYQTGVVDWRQAH